MREEGDVHDVADDDGAGAYADGDLDDYDLDDYHFGDDFGDDRGDSGSDVEEGTIPAVLQCALDGVRAGFEPDLRAILERAGVEYELALHTL